MPHKVGFYIRVSTEEQAVRVEGSLDSQRHRLQSWVDLKKLQDESWGNVIKVYVDEGLSAKDLHRPQLQRLLGDIKKGKINLVLVTDLARLSRSIQDFCHLVNFFKEHKAKFQSIKEQFDTTTAAGELVLYQLMTLAQFERKQVSERVTANFFSRAQRGLRNGGHIPMGFKVEESNKSTFVINDDEAEQVKQIFEIFLENGSLYRTAAKLNELGLVSRKNTGKVWNSQNVSSVLRNRAYIGEREINKDNKSADQSELESHEKYQKVKASWPAFIDGTVFDIAQTTLDLNSKFERTRLEDKKVREFLLTGILTCGECGRSLAGATGKGRSGEYQYYIHRPLQGKPVECNRKSFRADEVENLIEKELLHETKKDCYFDDLEKRIFQNQKQRVGAAESQRKQLESTVQRTEKGIRRLIEIQIESEDVKLLSVYSDQIKKLKTEKDLAANKLKEFDDVVDPRGTAKVQTNTIQENIKALDKAWRRSSFFIKKKLLRAMFEKVVVSGSKIQISFSTLKTIEISKAQNEYKGVTANKAGAPVFSNILESFNFSGFFNNSMVKSGQVIGIGCGGWI